ncbi:hypothetical protein [Flavobacterium panacagri]|uniref:hypothetical protein n=1 Tax=Flavobacterium panacagri TaxID=3034146 RepID=UPI0025A6858A|nr:hypothetical protein [Flavobacterium panacagri]
MTLTLRSLSTYFLFIILISNFTNAQPRVGQSIKASIGFASSSSYYIEDYGNQDELDVMDSGLYLQAEYIFGIKSWFGLRSYAATISTKIDKNQPPLLDQPLYKVTTRALLVGGKVRFCAPIPWVAPFIEGGIGASIGSFQTFTPSTNFDKNDVLMHIPFSIGLAVGRKNNIELALSGYFHPAAKQSNGVFAAGFTFPVD